MANPQHLELLEQGVEIFNQWRKENPNEQVDLSEANLNEANLDGANLNGAILNGSFLRGVNLSRADLSGSFIIEVNLIGAKLIGANLKSSQVIESSLIDADLSGANLSKTNFAGTFLTRTNCSGANFSGANLGYTNCVGTNFTNANLENANIYGISIWDIQKEGLIEKNLRITKNGPNTTITVDHIEVAQFIYLMLNNENIRNVLGTISSKGVLILGRFTPERKKILDAIRNKLREHDFVPMMFDFEKVSSKDFTETIKVLAGMSKFVIADITSPKSSPLELQATIPDYKIPFLPIIQTGEEPFSMFKDLRIYPWVLKTLKYSSENDLMESFQKGIIDRALEKANELLQIKTSAEETLDSKDFK